MIVYTFVRRPVLAGFCVSLSTENYDQEITTNEPPYLGRNEVLESYKISSHRPCHKSTAKTPTISITFTTDGDFEDRKSKAPADEQTENP